MGDKVVEFRWYLKFLSFFLILHRLHNPEFVCEDKSDIPLTATWWEAGLDITVAW